MVLSCFQLNTCLGEHSRVCITVMSAYTRSVYPQPQRNITDVSASHELSLSYDTSNFPGITRATQAAVKQCTSNNSPVNRAGQSTVGKLHQHRATSTEISKPQLRLARNESIEMSQMRRRQPGLVSLSLSLSLSIAGPEPTQTPTSREAHNVTRVTTRQPRPEAVVAACTPALTLPASLSRHLVIKERPSIRTGY